MCGVDMALDLGHDALNFWLLMIDFLLAAMVDAAP
jgi:hypothetical protein